MIQDFLYEIEPHFFKEYPREACGVLAVQKGKAKWFPCTNIAEENDDFIIDSTEYLKIKAKVTQQIPKTIAREKDNAVIIPRYTATPFPPLKFNQIGKMWPIKQIRPDKKTRSLKYIREINTEM